MTNGQSPSAASPPAPLGPLLQEIQQLLDSSQNHLAFETAQRLLRGDVQAESNLARLTYLAALAAARSGARLVAEKHLRDLRQIQPLDPALASDAESLAGRIAKDACADASNADARLTLAQRALHCYLRADAMVQNTYAKINAASMAAIVGDDALAMKIAGEVIALLKEQPEDHWHAATCGEAYLLMRDLAQAATGYAQARTRAGNRFGDIASMRRQLMLLKHVRPEATALLEKIPGPNVVAFSGHMIDAAGRASPRFPANLESAVREALEREVDKLTPLVAYSQAANGSDILFCEAVLARGQELNIVLPFSREDYLAQSVSPGGASWATRFDAVLAQASSVTYATDGRYLGDDTLFEHASDLIQGLASLRAQSLAVSPTMLVVADPSQAGAIGGTLATLASWRARGHQHRVIDLKPLREAIPPPPASPTPTTSPSSKPTPIAGGRHIKFLLFADVKGFSKLQEEHSPGFFTTFLGAVPKVLQAHAIEPLEMSSRGDGLYMVFGTAEAAARFSWELSAAMGAVDWGAMQLPVDTHVRIALHAGPVFIAVDPVNRTLAHYGSHVTRAARVEPIVVPGQILVTEPFAAVLAAQAESKFACDLVGIEPLAKGYGESRLYRLRLV